MRALVISRTSDLRRRERIQAIMPSSFQWSFLNAIDGHRPEEIAQEYAALFPETFWGHDHIKPGAFGCFVSHYQAWVDCATAGVPTLILEDDITFSDVIQRIDRLWESAGDKFDVVFMNRTAVSWLDLEVAYRRMIFIPSRRVRALAANKLASRLKARRIEVFDLAKTVERLVNANLVPLIQDTVGADCYLVTPAGARKLIELAQLYQARMGVDWFILGSGMPGFHSEGSWKIPQRAGECFVSPKVSRIGVINRWLAASEDEEVGGSTINHSISLSIKDYGARLNLHA